MGYVNAASTKVLGLTDAMGRAILSTSNSSAVFRPNPLNNSVSPVPAPASIPASVPVSIPAPVPAPSVSVAQPETAPALFSAAHVSRQTSLAELSGQMEDTSIRTLDRLVPQSQPPQYHQNGYGIKPTAPSESTDIVDQIDVTSESEFGDGDSDDGANSQYNLFNSFPAGGRGYSGGQKYASNYDLHQAAPQVYHNPMAEITGRAASGGFGLRSASLPRGIAAR